MPRRRDEGTLRFYEKPKILTKDLLREIMFAVVSVTVAVALAFMVVYVVGMQVRAAGDAMLPTLEDGDIVLVNRYAYIIAKPKPGDLVVFLPNGNTALHYSIRRVVATPGQTVVVRDGDLYVDGSLHELGSGITIGDAGIAQTEYVVPKGQYFVLGDNPSASEDSRSANVGAVSIDTIAGRAWCCLTDAAMLK